MPELSRKNKAVLLIVLSALFFTGMNACVRLAGDLPPVQKSFFRNFVAAIFAAVTLAKTHTPVKIPKGCRRAMFMRAFCGTVGILCNFYAIDKLALADASMLNKLSPFFAVIFSMFILKEKTTAKQIVAVVIAFAGSLFIIRPTFANLELVPSLIGFLGGVAAGAAYTFVRYMGQRGVKGPIIVFCFSLFSCMVTLPIMLAGFEPMSAAQLLILLLAGLFAAGGQFAITGAYSFAPAKEVSVYDYSQVIFAAIAGFFLFDQIPVPMSIIGYVIIISVAVWTFIQNNKATDATNKTKGGLNLFSKIDNYFDLKHKIYAAIGSVVFAIVWLVLWDMFPMQFYSLFCASLVGSFVQLILLNAVVVPVFLLIFTLVTKTDLSFCKLVPVNVVCIFGIEILRLFIGVYGWSMYLLIAGILVHGAICLWAFATAPIRDNRAPKGMKAPAPEKEIAIKKQPLIAVIWAVAFAFSIDMVCLWLYRVMALIYYPEMA